MPGPPKVQRVSGDEIRRRWNALSLSQRQEVTRFEDLGLVNCIRSAVNSILAKQIAIQRAGQRPSHLAAPDFFVDSVLMKEVFDLPWKTYTADEFPDAVLMDIDDQVPLMTVRAEMLQGNLIFERMSRVVPDFLGSNVRRTPIHRARWKKLCENLPTSEAALEQQLVYLMEQAFWWLGSNPAFAASNTLQNVTATTNVAENSVVPFEDWMTEPALGKVSQAASKSKKKRTKKKSSRSTGDHVRQAGDAEEYEDDDNEVSATEAAEHVTQMTSHLVSPLLQDGLGSVPRSGPLMQRGIGASAADIDKDEESTPSSSSISRPDRWQVVGDSKKLLADSRPHVQGGNAATPVSESVEDATTHSRLHCTPVADVEVSKPDYDTVLAVDARPRAPSLETAIVETPVVHDHYWGQQEQSHRSRPSLQWCLPSGIWSRGRWARSRQGDPPASGIPVVRVQNTFINLEENVEPDTGTRLSRSLSPAHCRSEID